MRVGELMTVDVKACGPWDSLNRAAQIMWENDCGCVPVADDAGRAVGMLTDRDICMAAYTQGRLLAEISVSSAMSKTIVSCGADDAVAAAERLMREERVRRLAVVEADGRLAGILSLSDIARRARRARHERSSGKKKTELSLSEVGETLGSICEQPHSADASAAEAWVAWTGTRAKPGQRRAAGNEKDEPAASELGGRAGKLKGKPTVQEKRG